MIVDRIVAKFRGTSSIPPRDGLTARQFTWAWRGLALLRMEVNKDRHDGQGEGWVGTGECRVECSLHESTGDAR